MWNENESDRGRERSISPSEITGVDNPSPDQ